MRKVFLVVLMICAVMSTAWAAGQQDGEVTVFPEKPIEIYVGYSVGGGTDVITRKLAQSMEEYLGQSVVVVNKPGGGGLVSMQELVVSKPDGYILGVLTNNQFLQKHLKTSLSWIDPLKDVDQIGVFNSDAWGIAVQADAPFNTLPEFVEYAKANPGVKVGAGGPASLYYWSWKDLMAKTGIELIIVPFKGTSLALKAVAGGELMAAGAGAPEADSLVRSNLIKMLGIAATERLPAFPDTETFKEQGVDFVFGPWRSIAAPAGLPEDVLAKLSDALDKAYHSDGFQEFINTQGFGGMFYSSEDTKGFYQDQDDSFIGLLSSTGDLRE